MEGQTVNSNAGKSRRNKVKVVCNWSRSKEITPGFRRLMSLLLKNRKGMSNENR